MGWLAGLLSGYADRHQQIAAENMQQALADNAREADIYKMLLNSPNEEIATMAGVGLMETGGPRRPKSGLQGWMGQMRGNPMYPKLYEYMTTPRRLGEDLVSYTPGTLTSTQYQGYLPGLPSPDSHAALPSTSPTQGGPMRDPLPAPPQPQAPGPQADLTYPNPDASSPYSPLNEWLRRAGSGHTVRTPGTAAEANSMMPPEQQALAQNNAWMQRVPTPGLEPPPAPPGMPERPDPLAQAGQALFPWQTQMAGGPSQSIGVRAPHFTAGAIAGEPPPPMTLSEVRAAEQPTAAVINSRFSPGLGDTYAIRERMGLPQAFPRIEDLRSAQYLGDIRGEFQGYTQMFLTADPSLTPQEAAAKAAQYITSVGLRGRGGTVNIAGQSYAEGNVIPSAGHILADGSTSRTGWVQELYLRADPRQRAFIEAQPPLTPETAAARAAAVTTARNAANQNAPVSSTTRSALVGQYQDRWNQINRPVREMEASLRIMEQAYNRYMAGDRSQWEPLRTAFVHVSEPNSVVMPSEFMRASGVLSLRDMIWGYVGQLKQGGSPLPDHVIHEMMRGAVAMWAGMATYGAQQKSAIDAAIADPTVNIPPEMIYGTEPRYQPQIAAPPPAAPPPAVNPNPNPNPGVANPNPGTAPPRSRVVTGPDGKPRIEIIPEPQPPK